MVEKYIKKAMIKVYRFLDRIIAFLTLLSLLSSMNPEHSCNEKSKQYKYAHSLSQQRLEKIYTDFKGFAEKGRYLKRTLKRLPNNPKEFNDLEYTRLILDKYTIRHDYAIMCLSFCMDQSIDIEVHGLLSDTPKVKIVWGELERIEETLWERN